MRLRCTSNVLRPPGRPAIATCGSTSTPADQQPDVVLNVPNFSVDEITLKVDNLQVHVALDAQLASLLKLTAGADASIDQVDLSIKGVKGQGALIVRLDSVRAIIGRTLQTLDNTPPDRHPADRHGRQCPRCRRFGRQQHRFHRRQPDTRRAPLGRGAGSCQERSFGRFVDRQRCWRYGAARSRQRWRALRSGDRYGGQDLAILARWRLIRRFPSSSA